MAYVTKGLNLVAPAVGQGEGGSVWSYVGDGTDNVAAIIAAGFIDDGADKGMKVGDLVLIVANAETGIAQVTVIDTSVNASGDVTMVGAAV